jgi:hypothetical protein
MKDPPPMQYARKYGAPVGDSVDLTQDEYDNGNDMDVDDGAELERRQRQQEREEAHARRAQPEYQDGRYGFSESSEPAYRDDYRDNRDNRDNRRDSRRDRGYDNNDRGYDRYETRGRGSREGGLASDDLLKGDGFKGRGQW